MEDSKGTLDVLQERLDVIKKYQKRTWITLVIVAFIVLAGVCAVFVLRPGAITPAVAGDPTPGAPETAIPPSAVPAATPEPTPEPMSVQSAIQTAVPAATPEPASMQTFFQSPAAPDQDYLDRILQSAIEVNTADEFTNALSAGKTIVVKKDINLNDNSYFLRDVSALVIDEGVTLTITSPNLYPDCTIVNFGEIIVADYGRMLFYHEPDYACIGKVSISGSNASVGFNTGKIGADEIVYFLSEGSLFNELNIVAASSDENLVEILIDHDIVIPARKTLWINAESVLHVPEGVTLTNNGFVRYHNEPIIEGKIVGTGKEYYA